MQNFNNFNENSVFDLRNSPFSIFDNEIDESKYVLDSSIVYGKDYPSGYVDYDMFRILNCLNNSEHNLNSILSYLALESSFNEVQIKDILIDNDFIKPDESSVKDINVKEAALKMNANQLSDLLKKYGIVASGKKKKLIKLVIKNIPESGFIDDYLITSEGLNFLKEFRWISLYAMALGEFEFNEFYKYIDEREGDYFQIALDFVDDHLNHAIDNNDFKYYDICLDARANIYAFDDYDLKTALCEEIKRMILRLNPIMYTYSDFYSEYLIFNPENIDNIKFYVSELNIEDFKDLFFKIWDELNLEKEYVSKEVAFDYLEKVFETKEYDDLSNKFEIEYFENSQEYFNIALNYYNDDNYNYAGDYFNFSLEMEPEQIDALYYLAMTYYMLNDYESAINTADEAIKLNSADARFFCIKGKCYSDLNQKDKAKKYFENALELNSEDTLILNAIGDFYFEEEEFEKALKYYDDAYQIDNGDLDVINNKIRVFLELKKWDEAEKYLEDMHKITGDDSEYFTKKGGYFVVKEEFEKAIECFDKVLEIDNQQAHIWMFKALSFNKLNDNEQFEKCVDEANKINPVIPQVFLEILKDDL